MLNKFESKHPIIYLVVVAFIFGFITILSCSCITSFLYPQMSGYVYYNDALVFCELGKSMVQGYKPYVDIFDHKGLYIFYYTAIGGILGIKGVMIVQVLLISIVFAFIYKSLKIYTNDKLLIFSALFFFGALYAFTGQTPNDCDLELPFITIMIYFYLLGIKDNDYKKFMYGNIALGIATGIAFNLRMSDALVPFAFVCFYAYKSIKDKQVKYIFRDAGIVIGLILLMSIPPFVHAYFGGFFDDMVQSVYLNNFKYITTTGMRRDGVPMVAYILLPIIAGLFILLTILKRKELTIDDRIFIYVTMGVSFLVELVIAFYPHYLIVLYSYLVIILGRLISLYVKTEENKARKPILIGLASIFVISLFFNPTIYAVNYQKDMNTINYINNTVTDEDKDGHILIFGPPALYELTGIRINYGDFTCQTNHVLISERYSTENLIKFLNSEECHYYMVSPVNSIFLDTVEFDRASYELVPTDLNVSVTIYHHII